jgi:uncharacterized protein (TIGR02646 family)
MKYISKKITDEAANALQTFIRLEKEKAHYDNFKQSDGKDKVQKSLLEEQGYLCAYCMQRIEHPPKIEHWVTREHSNQHQQPHQTLDYDNILAVCQGKTTLSGHVFEHCDSSRSKSNRILTVQPTDIRTIQKIQFLKNGTIESDDDAIQNDLNQPNSLNLNALFLRDARKRVYESVKKLIDLKCKGKTPAQAKKIITEIVDDWESKKKIEDTLKYKEYCAIVSYFFRKYVG